MFYKTKLIIFYKIYQIGIICNDTKENKNSQNSKNIISNKSNISTKNSQENNQEADKNTNEKHISLSEKPPFLLCRFASVLDLSESILDLSYLSFIKFADGLENDYIYALEPLIVGKTNFFTGEFEVIICGQILTKKDFEELEDVFKKHGGKIGNFHKQEIKKRN